MIFVQLPIFGVSLGPPPKANIWEILKQDFCLHCESISIKALTDTFIAFVFCCCVTVSSDLLWGGVTGVSNAGRKKGRGKRVGRKKATDLNRGQRLGVGKQNLSVFQVFISYPNN